MNNNDVVIIDGCRTAVGNMGGTLKSIPAVDLATVCLKGIIDRTGVDAAQIDDVILGQCRQTSDEPNIARVAALQAGIPVEVPAYTTMRQCASGMTAVHNAYSAIKAGVNDLVLAGGTESMSRGVFYIRDARYGVGTGNTELVDAITEGQFRSQPQEVYGSYNMGATAENIALEYGITRQEQDEFSFSSQQKAIAAIDAGKFKDEIVPVVVPQRKKDPIIFDTDEFPRRDTSLEKMAKLKPVFNIVRDEKGRVFNTKELTGTVTAASSSGRNDGASVLMLASGEKAAELGVKPIARIIGIGTAGCDPRFMGMGPIYAVPKALKMAGLTLDDIGLIELNEAFAAQALICIKKLGLENRMDIINVNGGAVALGHPVGSSGSRIIVTLMYEMKRRGVKYGLATLCIAGGMGQAAVIELLED
ncbi:MAG: acetyl-CoA C-acetyltransferase [Lachnospiraceae bacterium]|nr:acetyl-CoA C-acetyltransferase [Lachnospiraceae bacterium]